jgi:hypothetical protein
MDRGVFIGGGLICASFLVAVLLNESPREVTRVPEPPKAADVERPLAQCDEITDQTLHREAPAGTMQQPSSGEAADEANCR